MTVSRLERASHISIIVLAVVAIAAIVDQRIGVWRQPARRNVASQLVGKTISIPSVAWDQGSTNVVVAMTTHCPYCEASMPFYRRVAAALHETSAKKSVLIFASPEPIVVTNAYLDQQKIAPDKVVSMPLKDLDLSSTPSLLIVDDSGRVKHAYAGKLSQSNESLVLKLLTGVENSAGQRF